MAERVDHDALFKLLLTTFFREFLALFAPQLEAQLMPEPLTFLDKESFANLLDPDRREADLVVQAQLLGEPTTFLIHLEHQAQHDALLDRRMFRYFSRFYDVYNTPIYPIALCSYATPRQLATNRHRVMVQTQTILHFQYHMVQLNQLSWRDYLQSDNPVAAALMARMPVAKSERWRVKAACMRLLAGQVLTASQRRLIGQFVDQYLPLNTLQEAAFRAEIAAFQPLEQEVVMELVTSWERRALAKGRKQGRVEGQREIVLQLLTHKFGALPTKLAAQFDRLTADQVSRLATALLAFHNTADAERWFAALDEM
jgi:Domain of unknown function (DUF4351)